MSDFAKTAAMMVIGGIVGVGGFAALTHDNDVEASAPPAVVAPVIAETSQAPVETPASHAITVATMVTGGVEQNRPGAAFAVFDVETTEDVANVELTVTGAPGTRPQEAIGAPYSRTGDRMTIDLGELDARERKQVVVAFKLSHESGDFTVHANYDPLHGDSKTARTDSVERGLSTKHRNKDAYEVVRTRYSADTIELAERLRDEGEYSDALAWVEDAHQANVLVGMTLRLTGPLAPYQKKLGALGDELRDLMKPKAKRKMKVVEKPGIEVYRLDKRNWRGTLSSGS